VSTLPEVFVFDVNETLSDTTALARSFAEVGAPEHLAVTWFAQVLRDGFALTATHDSATFADIASSVLDALLGPLKLTCPPQQAKAIVMSAFAGLPLHPDVTPGLRALRDLGPRLVTLSNGASSVAGSLLENADLSGLFDQLLSVDDAQGWKPGADSYRWASQRCGVDPQDLMLVAVHPWDITVPRAPGCGRRG